MVNEKRIRFQILSLKLRDFFFEFKDVYVITKFPMDMFQTSDLIAQKHLFNLFIFTLFNVDN